jgi:peptidoglycan/LPS O-acetylase OafA/YrhL
MHAKLRLPRVEILDPLRGLAALAVAWYHFTNCSGLVETEWLRASGAYGWLGVEVFFVISGFVIPYSMYGGGYVPSQHFGRFLAKRLLRLEPPYLASIVLVVALAYVASLIPSLGRTMPEFSALQLLLHLGYLNTFFGYLWLNPVYWTLGIEFQYYLLIAMIYPLFKARSAILRALVVLSMAGAGVVVESPMLVFHYLGLFTLGILVFQYHAGFIREKTLVVGVVGIAALTAMGLNPLIGLVGGTTALVIAFVPMPRLSIFRALVFLGTISYSLYLLHTIVGGPMVNLGLRFMQGPAGELGVVAMAVAGSVVAAVCFNRLVERLAQKLSSRIRYCRTDTSLSSGPPPLPAII